MRRSLAVSTGDLPMVQGGGYSVLETDTEGGIAAGTFHAAVSSIRTFRHEIELLGVEPITWFLTGGGRSPARVVTAWGILA